MQGAAIDHLGWLAQALEMGAVHYDSFEIARHFDVSPGRAVEIGRTLHAMASGPRALSDVERIDLIVTYRAVSGEEARLSVPLASDGRLGTPTLD